MIYFRAENQKKKDKPQKHFFLSRTKYSLFDKNNFLY